jgi:hypothetical protein
MSVAADRRAVPDGCLVFCEAPKSAVWNRRISVVGTLRFIWWCAEGIWILPFFGL